MVRPSGNVLQFYLALNRERHPPAPENVKEDEMWLRTADEVLQLYGDFKDEGHWDDFVGDVFLMMCDHVHLLTCDKHGEATKAYDICLCRDHSRTCTQKDMELFAGLHKIPLTRPLRRFWERVLQCTYPDYSSDEEDPVELEE